MTRDSSFDAAALAPESARHVDEICTRFELAWKRGDRPRIEEYLGDSADAERPALLAELILLELDYRRSFGEDCRAGDYRDRFPGLDPTWLDRAIAASSAASVEAGRADGRRARGRRRRSRTGRATSGRCPSAIICSRGRSPAAGWGSSTRRGRSTCIAGSPSR